MVVSMTYGLLAHQLSRHFISVWEMRGSETVRGTVLVVEDDDHVRCFMGMIFRQWGWTVLTAASGGEARARLHEANGAITLLVSDVNLPDVHGTDLAHALREIQPGIRVLLLTGDDTALWEASNPDAVFVQKPFTISGLESSMADVLGGQRARAVVGC